MDGAQSGHTGYTDALLAKVEEVFAQALVHAVHRHHEQHVVQTKRCRYPLEIPAGNNNGIARSLSVLDAGRLARWLFSGETKPWPAPLRHVENALCD